METFASVPEVALALPEDPDRAIAAFAEVGRDLGVIE